MQMTTLIYLSITPFPLFDRRLGGRSFLDHGFGKQPARELSFHERLHFILHGHVCLVNSESTEGNVSESKRESELEK